MSTYDFIGAALMCFLPGVAVGLMVARSIARAADTASAADYDGEEDQPRVG